MVLSDGNALRNAVSKAGSSAFADSASEAAGRCAKMLRLHASTRLPGLDDKLLESARAALREMTLLDQARETVKSSSAKRLRSDTDEHAKKVLSSTRLMQCQSEIDLRGEATPPWLSWMRLLTSSYRTSTGSAS